MSVQIDGEVNTRPLILSEYPIALRKDNETIIQNASRTAVLSSRTLMGKEVVESAVAAGAVVGTGNGTITLATVAGSVIPKVGVWSFVLTAALIGKLVDPDGVIVASNIAIADGAAIILNIAGFQFTVTDGITAFTAGASISLTVVAVNKWTPYSKTNLLGANKPLGIFDPECSLGDITAAALVSADVEDVPILISGARFDSGLLVIENSGALTDIVSDTGLTVEEYLRQNSLISEGAIAGSSVENS